MIVVIDRKDLILRMEFSDFERLLIKNEDMEISINHYTKVMLSVNFTDDITSILINDYKKLNFGKGIFYISLFKWNVPRNVSGTHTLFLKENCMGLKKMTLTSSIRITTKDLDKMRRKLDSNNSVKSVPIWKRELKAI